MARVTRPLRVRIRRILALASRVTFLIDGFNLHHSIIDLGRFQNLHAKWLNIHSLCSSFLHLISKDANLADIYCFSAFAHHLSDPNVIKRHQDHIECLKYTGIIPEMGRFKRKGVTCPLRSQLAKSHPRNVKCPLHGEFVKHEEKQTDVAIAARLFEVIFNNKCDTVVLLTGDTDLTPAVKACKRLLPSKTRLFAFPYRRYNQELELLLPGSFRINGKTYVRHLFPDPLHLPGGNRIYKIGQLCRVSLVRPHYGTWITLSDDFCNWRRISAKILIPVSLQIDAGQLCILVAVECTYLTLLLDACSSLIRWRS